MVLARGQAAPTYIFNFKYKLVIGIAVVAGLVGLADSNAGVLKIETKPRQAIVAQGENLFLDYRVDSRDIPDKIMRSGNWHVALPSGMENYMNNITASLPDPNNNPSQNPDDVFYNILLNPIGSMTNVVKPFINGESTLNCRGPPVVNLKGFQNREGIIGVYSFLIDANAPLGDYNFSTDSIYFYDTNGKVYGSILGGSTSTCTVTNTPFKIAKGGDANLDGKVGLIDLGAVAGNWNYSGNWQQGDFNNDGVVGLTDLGMLAANWNWSAPESSPAPLNVPEPATTALLGGGLIGMGMRRRNRPPGPLRRVARRS